MDFLERDLEEIIMETNSEILKKRGLPIQGYRKQQLNIGKYGRSDIVTFYKKKDVDFVYGGVSYVIITIYELKKDNISMSSLLQAIRYAKGIDDYLKTREVEFYWEFRFVLIGKEIKINSDFVFITDVIDNVSFYTYNMNIDGLYFKEVLNYSLIEKGF